MTPEEVAAALESGAVPLDLRPPRAFASEHLPGALALQFNRADLADRAELMLPTDLRLVVHAEPEPIAKVAVELLAGAGFTVLGVLEGGIGAWKDAGYPIETLPLLDVDELYEQASRYSVIDAREPYEHRHASIPGSVPLPPDTAWRRADELDAGTRLAVVCGDQTRSAYVASVLRRKGKDAALVTGGMADWLERGYPVEKKTAPA
jgi:hydroxyacylglutathione hydrolase